MALQIVQITDTHISSDTPSRTKDLERCVEAINDMQPQPALVIHTGDITHHGTREEYHIARKELDKLLSPFIVIPGNKDIRSELLNTFKDERYTLAPEGWVQYAIDDFSVRLLMVDTVSEDSNKGQLCKSRLEHLHQMLLANTEKPTALFLHHTPFKATGVPDPFQFEDWTQVDTLGNMLSQFNNICGIYCGHVHRFADGEIANIPASAITCLAGDLRKGDVSDDERLLPVFKRINLL